VLQAAAEDSDGGFARYRLVVQPWLGFLAQTLRGRVWQEQNVTAMPAGTSIFASKPLPQHVQAMMQPPTPAATHAHPNPAAPAPVALAAACTTMVDCVVGIRYAGGDGTAAQGADAVVSTYELDGTVIGTPRREAEAEYQIYPKAKTISAAFPAGARPAVAAVHELLRFGRVTGPDTLSPVDVPHWREVNHPGGQGWVNLNASNIHKFSDADFPQWKNWKLVSDDTNGDSRCDSAILIGLASGNAAPNAPLDRVNAARQLANAAVRAKLLRTICKFPSEWDASTIDQRWAWLKTKSDDNLQPLSDDDYAKLKAHAQALCFALPALFTAQWSFNPKDFIQHFRQCAWLSAPELDKVYPDSLYPASALARINETPASVKSRYRASINRATLKYSVVGPTRRTHFYGQGAVESMYLALMLEGAVSFTRNPTHASFASEAAGYYHPAPGGYLDYLENKLGNIEPGDGPKFRGRGMKQLTGRENYSKYWVYRGWLDSNSFHSPWWNPARPAIAAAIPDPQRLSIDAFNAIDAGGWYWEAGSQVNRFRSINSVIGNHDFSPAAIESVTRAINGGVNGLPQRSAQTLRIKDVLSDEV
jgi:predicted chitinase